jgi:hypothetical protein
MGTDHDDAAYGMSGFWFLLSAFLSVQCFDCTGWSGMEWNGMVDILMYRDRMRSRIIHGGHFLLYMCCSTNVSSRAFYLSVLDKAPVV